MTLHVGYRESFCRFANRGVLYALQANFRSEFRRQLRQVPHDLQIARVVYVGDVVALKLDKIRGKVAQKINRGDAAAEVVNQAENFFALESTDDTAQNIGPNQSTALSEFEAKIIEGEADEV